MGEMTPARQKALFEIHFFYYREGYYPSLKDIANSLGVSIQTAQYYVRTLRRMGYLLKGRPHTERNLRLSKMARVYLNQLSAIPAPHPPPKLNQEIANEGS